MEWWHKPVLSPFHDMLLIHIVVLLHIAIICCEVLWIFRLSLLFQPYLTIPRTCSEYLILDELTSFNKSSQQPLEQSAVVSIILCGFYLGKIWDVYPFCNIDKPRLDSHRAINRLKEFWFGLNLLILACSNSNCI